MLALMESKVFFVVQIADLVPKRQPHRPILDQQPLFDDAGAVIILLNQ